MSQAAQQELLNKITVKGILGKIDKPTAPINLIRVAGIVSGYEVVTTNFGDSLKIRGQIRAVRLSDGAVFNSPVAYLPTVASAVIQSALDSNEGASAIEFAFDIGVKPSDKGQTGYEFSVYPLIQPTENDPLAKLMSNLPTLAIADKTKKGE